MTRRTKKEYLWLLAILVLVSTMVTLHLGHRLLWLRDGSFEHFTSGTLDTENSEHLSILRNIKRTANDPLSNDSHPTDVNSFNNNNNINNNNNNNITTNGKASYKRPKDDHNYVYGQGDTNEIDISVREETNPFHERGDSIVKKNVQTHNIKGLDGVRNSPDHHNHHRQQQQNETRYHNYQEDNKDILKRDWTSKTGPSKIVSALSRSDGKVKGDYWSYQHTRFSRTHVMTGLVNKREHIEKMEDVTALLSQIENMTLTPMDITRPVVVIEGALTAVKQHFPVMESAFHKYKMAAIFKAWEDGKQEAVGEDQNDSTTENTSWSVLICLNTTDDDGQGCIVSARHARTKEYQKVNIIPGMSKAPSKSCYSDNSPDVNGGGDESNDQKTPGKWYGGDLPCLIYSSLLLSSSSPSSTFPASCEATMGWWMSRDQESKATNHFLPCDRLEGEMKSLDRSMVVPLPSKLVTLKNSHEPLVWQVHILVTSLSPLRAYLHPSGIIWEGLDAFINRKLPRKVSLLDLQQLISDLHSEDQAMTTLSQLEDAVRKSLMFMEKQTPIERDDNFYSRFFQLFEAVMVFNSTFHPLIIQVNPSSYVDGLSSLSKYLVEQNILEDLAAMLSSRVSVVKDVAKIFTDLGLIRVEDFLCTTDRDFCLNRSDLIYLLDTRREHGASRNWRRLCPSISTSCYSDALFSNVNSIDVSNENQDLHTPNEMGDGDSPDVPLSLTKNPHQRKMFHSFVTAVETAFLDPKVEDFWIDQYDDINIPIEADQPRKGINDLETANVFNASYIPFSRSCDNNSDSMPHLSAIHVHPHLILQPQFSPLTTEYYTHVSHDTLLISIRVLTKNCKAVAILEDRHVSSGWVNFTLGIGENVAHIVVVESGHPYSHWGLNTYKIRIHRRSQDQHLGVFDVKTKHQVCSLKQDCSLPYSKTDPCGLHQLKDHKDWEEFLQWKSSLRQCENYIAEGQWVVPCEDCNDSNTCYWRNALWGTATCQEKNLSKQSLEVCFKDKKVLFLGDSTIRGISHYLMERINGTLQDWDKTHNIKMYPFLNAGRTTVGFAYYPQFWLPLHNRPPFDEALKKLLQRAAPLSNSHKTVLALGGVHWLARHHIDVLLARLKSDGLTGINVVIKGLGAGFHQPVTSTHHLTLKDHEKIMFQNMAVLSYAQTKGFQVVDTFNMTMSRYTEFLQGKCACHFQRVTKQRVSIWNKLSRIPSSSDLLPIFHVEGDIGAAYSEMMMNRICDIS